MADLGAVFRECLAELDVVRLFRVYTSVFPQMPQPASTDEAEVILHTARTGSQRMPLEKRLYSHAWLTERGMKSQLPDDLRPPSERVGSVIVPAVGVAVASTSSRADRREEAKALERVMAQAAGDMVRDGITDRARIAPVMWQARENFIRGKLRKML